MQREGRRVSTVQLSSAFELDHICRLFICYCRAELNEDGYSLKETWFEAPDFERKSGKKTIRRTEYYVVGPDGKPVDPKVTPEKE